MKDVLDIWIKNFGGTWKVGDVRPGERIDEFLVGETELDYCESLNIGNIKHFLIDFNKKSQNPLPEVYSTRNATRLSDKEIRNILEAASDVL